MADKTSWTEADFDDMSWHDNHVHAFRIREGEHGTGEVELDLDYILEWLSPTEGMFSCRVAPASLTFRGVYDLQIAIDYAVVSAGLSPLCISQIARETATDGGSHRWEILLNWPAGHFRFRAEGFGQRLRTTPVVTQSQGFTHDERTTLGA